MKNNIDELKSIIKSLHNICKKANTLSDKFREEGDIDSASVLENVCANIEYNQIENLGCLIDDLLDSEEDE